VRTRPAISFLSFSSPSATKIIINNADGEEEKVNKETLASSLICVLINLTRSY
jgi:hypothetical protein